MKNQIKAVLLSASLAAFLLPAVAQDSSTTQTSTTTSTTQAAPPVTQQAPTAQVPPRKPEVSRRVNSQQGRIAQGVQSGQLTAGETANLENKEAGINKEIRQDRQANGGKLTPEEKAKINRQQKRDSHQIYKDKHNNSKR